MPAQSFWQGKRVLLTGHTGFKGSWCALWLQMLGADVYGLALPPNADQALWRAIGAPGGDAMFGDIRDKAFVGDAFAQVRPEIVIHMAAQALVHPSYDDPAETFDVNVMGLVRILDAARCSPSVRAVINVTSDKCYENREQIWGYRETDAMGGADPYSASKGCAELVTAAYRRAFFANPEGPQVASGRAGNVIGGGDMSKDRLVPDCLRALSKGEVVVIRNPAATRPWQHVLEPVAGYLALAEVLYLKGHAFAQGWNFGPPDDDAWPVGRIVDHIVACWGENAAWRQDDNSWPHEATLLRVDATKARARLGWRPQLTTATAIDWTVDWHKAALDGANMADISRDQISRYESGLLQKETVRA